MNSLILGAAQQRLGGGVTPFLGEMSASELITGNALASTIGLTAGTSQHSNEPWLHFELDGKTLFVAKKSYRHSVSWDHINARGAVFGTRTVTIQGRTYKVRLLTGADTNPTSVAVGYNPIGTEESEWNRLLYNVHNGVHTNTNNTTPPGEWPLYSDADLLVHYNYGNGSYSWCQETHATNATLRVLRGFSGVTNFTSVTSSGTNAYFGWRPVLELID